MKSILVKAALGACIISAPATLNAGPEAGVQGYDEAAATLRELIRQAELNIRKVEGIIQERELAERNTARDEKAREAIERGNRLYAEGDLAGAKKAWKEALAVTDNPEMERYIADEERKAMEKAAAEKAALQARIDGLKSEGAALFERGLLDESEAKFREALSLDGSDRDAERYLQGMIPDARAERARIAEAERRAKAALEKAGKLYAAGDYAGAKSQWADARSLARTEETRAAVAASEGRADAEQQALLNRINGLLAEGIALFQQDHFDEAEARFREALSLKGTTVEAMEYLDVKIPARKAELARIAEMEKRARAAFAEGNRLYDAGDRKGAGAAWQRALSLAQSGETRVGVESRIAAAAEIERQEAAALKARIEQLNAEGVAFFRQESLDQAEAKFREALSLDAANADAKQYVESWIPGRRAELARREAVERKAKAVGDAAEKLFAEGEFTAAIERFREAAGLTETQEIRTAYLDRQRAAEAGLREQEAAWQARLDGLSADGVALFKQGRLDDSAEKFAELLKLDASNLTARRYADTLIPERKAELARIEAAEEKAIAALERGNKLYLAGNINGAKGSWEEALKVAATSQTRQLVARRISTADAEQRALAERIGKLQGEGVALFNADNLDAAAAKFREVLSLRGTDTDAMQYLDVKLPARKAELARIAEMEQNARSALARGNELYQGGEREAADAEWQKALELARSQETREAVTARIRQAEERREQERAALQVRTAGLTAEGIALFEAGRVGEAEAKFSQVLSLDPSNLGARQYLDSRIPARKAEIARRAEAEKLAKAAMERGNKLYAAGDFEGAKAAWKEALDITEKQR